MPQRLSLLNREVCRLDFDTNTVSRIVTETTHSSKPSPWAPVVTAVAVAWALLSNFACQERAACAKGDNMGWGYLLITMRGLTLTMFPARFAFFSRPQVTQVSSSKGRRCGSGGDHARCGMTEREGVYSDGV